MVNGSETAETVVRLIAVELGVAEDSVRLAKSLRGELGMDSIAAANLVFALEEEYGRDFEFEEGDKLDSVHDITRALDRVLSRDPA